MARRNVSISDELDEAARNAGLNVSALTQSAIVQALHRRDQMAALSAWLDELDAEYGAPSEEATAAAVDWLRSAVPASRGALPASGADATSARTPKPGRTAKTARTRAGRSGAPRTSKTNAASR